MNPQVDETSGLGLPQPGDMSQLPSIHAPQTFQAPQTPPPEFEISPSSDNAQPTTASVSFSPPVAQDNLGVSSNTASPSGSVPISEPVGGATSQFSDNSISVEPADDADTPFDEEWVSKAREIVEQTRTDPYMQSKDLSKLKAEYIKARYNKDVKIGTD